MSEHTAIEWCDSTFNPWEGCQKVGPGCDNCYAETRNARFGGGTAPNWGPGAPRRRTSAPNWRKPLLWEREHEAFALMHGRRRRVFCASLADVFDNAVPPAWRAGLFALIACTPNLDWLLLTKRIGNVPEMLAAPGMQKCGLPPNAWLGITVVNRSEMLRDGPKLAAVNARVRFWSVEPMLGDLGEIPAELMPAWVIAGGESGPKARPMHPDWFRSLRDQCAAAGVPFLFKQWGEWTPGENVERVRGTVDTAFLWDDEWSIHQLNLATDHGHIDDQPDLYRVGKKAAGRLLDAVEHNGFPAC